MDFINEKFSTRAKSALIAAQKIADELKSEHIGAGHLFYGIVAESGSFANEVVLKNRVTKELVRLELVRNYKDRISETAAAALSPRMRKILEKAAAAASRHGYSFVGTEHFLFAIVEVPENTALSMMKNLGLNTREIRRNLNSIFENANRFPEPLTLKDLPKDMDDLPGFGAGSAIEYFTVDLTERAKRGEIDPLIGREKETERLISILNRRTKNNPVLIGEPGVGKTAIVEGLALAIASGEAQGKLSGKKILSLDLALMVAGSMFRGEFEQRIKQLLDELEEEKNAIIFIDELHTVVGAGGTTGSLDAANILKPALARGEIRVIGATTLAEYKKYIETDAALERRFQTILVREPSQKETLEILRGLKPLYETFHNVEFTGDALAEAVNLSVRHITDRNLPDKAIDLLDETAAFHSGRSGEKVPSKTTITASHIAGTVSRNTGIPAEKMKATERGRLLTLETRLKKSIVGQNEAIASIAASVRRSRAGIASPDRPMGSFLFLGPSGVGKTMTAKLLARELFDDERALIRIDMSEFMQAHAIARLTGAPAGYVGYGEGGRLTEALRRRPYSVVLFDDMEKAHPDVFNILLQILEEGQLTDAAGKTVNCRNAIVILTSNLGLDKLNRWAGRFGFSDSRAGPAASADRVRQEVMGSVQKNFRQELLGRIDKIIIFNPLGQKEIQKIAALELLNLQRKLKERRIGLAVSREVSAWLAKISRDGGAGARLVRKNVQDLAEDQIARLILDSRVTSGKAVSLKIKNNRLIAEMD